MLYRVRLVRKLAQILNGVDLSRIRVGECVDLPRSAAVMLVREGWAVFVEPPAPADTNQSGRVPD